MAKHRRRFEFHPEAMIEARAAAEWYAERGMTASFDFKQELYRAENLVTERPESWSPYLHGTRCLPLKRFPYGLVYVDRGDRLIGIAVAHFKRKPGYWRQRLNT
jgi:hypothetical protein